MAAKTAELPLPPGRQTKLQIDPGFNLLQLNISIDVAIRRHLGADAADTAGQPGWISRALEKSPGFSRATLVVLKL